MQVQCWRAMLGLVLAVSALSPTASAQDPSLLEHYLDALEQHSAANLPLTDDATFFGSLLPEPIMGDEAVTAFLNRVLPSVELMEIKQRFEGPEGGCAELVFYFPDPDVILEEVHCLTFEDGSIADVRLYYDPRPLLEAGTN